MQIQTSVLRLILLSSHSYCLPSCLTLLSLPGENPAAMQTGISVLRCHSTHSVMLFLLCSTSLLFQERIQQQCRRGQACSAVILPIQWCSSCYLTRLCFPGEHPAAMQTGTSVLRCHSSHSLLLSLLCLLWILSSYILGSPMRRKGCSPAQRTVQKQPLFVDTNCEKLTPNSLVPKELKWETYYQICPGSPACVEQESLFDSHNSCTLTIGVSDRLILQPAKHGRDCFRKRRGCPCRTGEPFTLGKIIVNLMYSAYHIC